LWPGGKASLLRSVRAGSETDGNDGSGRGKEHVEVSSLNSHFRREKRLSGRRTEGGEKGFRLVQKGKKSLEEVNFLVIGRWGTHVLEGEGKEEQPNTQRVEFRRKKGSSNGKSTEKKGYIVVSEIHRWKSLKTGREKENPYSSGLGLIGGDQVGKITKVSYLELPGRSSMGGFTALRGKDTKSEGPLRSKREGRLLRAK